MVIRKRRETILHLLLRNHSFDAQTRQEYHEKSHSMCFFFAFILLKVCRSCFHEEKKEKEKKKKFLFLFFFLLSCLAICNDFVSLLTDCSHKKSMVVVQCFLF